MVPKNASSNLAAVVDFEGVRSPPLYPTSGKLNERRVASAGGILVLTVVREPIPEMANRNYMSAPRQRNVAQRVRAMVL